MREEAIVEEDVEDAAEEVKLRLCSFYLSKSKHMQKTVGPTLSWPGNVHSPAGLTRPIPSCGHIFACPSLLHGTLIEELDMTRRAFH